MKWAQLLIFGTIGLAALFGGVKWGLEIYPVFRDNVSARGTVVEQFEDRSGKTAGVVYFPVVEFSTRSTATVRFRDGAGSPDAPGYETGAPVDVLYDPRNPANARIGGFQQFWTGPLATSGIGLILLALSFLLFVKISRFEKGLKSMGAGKSKRPSE